MTGYDTFFRAYVYVSLAMIYTRVIVFMQYILGTVGPGLLHLFCTKQPHLAYKVACKIY